MQALKMTKDDSRQELANQAMRFFGAATFASVVSLNVATGAASAAPDSIATSKFHPTFVI
jgi:hypothetical protein